jgi:flagellar protein FlaG
MPTEISTINTTSNPATQVRQASPDSAPRPAAAAERQASVRNDQVLPQQQVLPTGEQESSVAQREKIDRAVSDINSFVQKVNRELQFSLEEELPLGRAVIRVIDVDTDEVIREIPSKEVLAIAERLSELSDSLTGENKLGGLIIQAQA